MNDRLYCRISSHVSVVIVPIVALYASYPCCQCEYSDYRAVDASVGLLRMLPRDT
nr:MAG TPA: hypothetical protein [Caudoviricetes sp.]